MIGGQLTTICLNRDNVQTACNTANIYDDKKLYELKQMISPDPITLQSVTRITDISGNIVENVVRPTELLSFITINDIKNIQL